VNPAFIGRVFCLFCIFKDDTVHKKGREMGDNFLEDSQEKIRRNVILISLFSILYFLDIVKLTGNSSIIGLAINPEKKDYFKYVLLVLQIYMLWRYLLLMNWKEPYQNYISTVKSKFYGIIYKKGKLELNKKIKMKYPLHFSNTTTNFKEPRDVNDQNIQLGVRTFVLERMFYDSKVDSEQFLHEIKNQHIFLYLLLSHCYGVFVDKDFSERILPLIILCAVIIWAICVCFMPVVYDTSYNSINMV
jgi:hypothetical protein